MTLSNFLKLFFFLQLVGLNAFAVGIHDNFRVDFVKPHGEFGFRVLGNGDNTTEMFFDCSKAKDIGLVVSFKNSYGKSHSIIMPSQKLGSEKFECHKNLQNYFAGFYSKRSMASAKNSTRSIEIDPGTSGLFNPDGDQKTLKLR